MNPFTGKLRLKLKVPASPAGGVKDNEVDSGVRGTGADNGVSLKRVPGFDWADDAES